MQTRKSKLKKGQSIIETAVGLAVIIIPLILVLVDLGVLITCYVTNNDLAKRAARAASSVLNNCGYADGQTAYGSATNICNSFVTSSIVTNVQVMYFHWVPIPGAAKPSGSLCSGDPSQDLIKGNNPTNKDAQPGEVMVATKMIINPPVPIPGFSNIVAVSQSIQPIVGVPPIIPP